jgi:hypothetical protein
VAASLPPNRSAQRKGITNPFCKESPCQTEKSGNIDHGKIAIPDSQSTAWEFFTDD